MAITTNALLEAAIAGHLARTDLTSAIPDFIVAGETRIAYGSKEPFESEPLRIRAMETVATLTNTDGECTLPSGFLGLKSIYEDGSTKGQLEQTSPELFYRSYNSSNQGPASFYIIEGETIKLAPSGSSDVRIVYYKKFDPIATASPVTWLLTNAPHVYVYAALLEAAPYIRNDARIQVWYGLFRSMVNALNSADKRDRWGGSSIAVRNDRGNP
jgi:hypothetical protein